MTARSRALRVFPLFSTVSGCPDWDDVYRRELPRIYNFFRYRVGCRATAEDLTSTTFEKAWRGRDGFRRDEAAFSTWLFAIARNVATDHFRRKRVEVPLEKADGEPASGDPESEEIRRSDSMRLQLLLRELPQREQELVALRYGAGHTNREIARLTGLSESNVGTILSRVAQGLRAAWERKEHGHE